MATSQAAWRLGVLGISVPSSHHLITQTALKSDSPGSTSSLLSQLGEFISPCNPYPYNRKGTTIAQLGGCEGIIARDPWVGCRRAPEPGSLQTRLFL